MKKKYLCEFIGTLVLVFFGCGTAVITGGDIVATSLAFGLAIVVMAYSIGKVSGCHVNPAVSLAMYINKKLSFSELCGYVVAQVLGAIAGTAILFAILKSSVLGLPNLGANGYGVLSNVELSLVGALITEIVLSFVFIFTILGVTSDESKENISGLIIGLALTFVHLIGINLTGTSVNPARSLGPALFAGGEHLKQLWVFVVAPLLGSILATWVYKYITVGGRKTGTKVKTKK